MTTNLLGQTAMAMRIYSEPSLEGQLKPYRRRLKRYKQRTLKRWARNPRHWTEPRMYIIDGAIVCAPSLIPRIRQLIGQAHG